ncbi:MAG: NUDIX domain-containing protein [Streptococcaceae bacterium]|jgi:mutator protein MutT|nr:NUDIX domain-containing protein [Streptococcaceae bacterium]
MDYISWIRSKVGHDKVFMNFAVAMIRNGKGEVLMQQRGDSGLWGFPGGCIELGETFEEALRREVYEETRIRELEIIHQLGSYNRPEFVYPNGDVAQCIDVVYICDLHETVDLSYRDSETMDLRWVDLSHLDVALFNPDFDRTIKDYLDWTGPKSQEDYIGWIRSKVGHDKIMLPSVVALIRNDKGEVLMQKRGDSGLWGLISGCMEMGESFETALRREIFEETGAQNVRIVQQLGIYNWYDSPQHFPNGDVAQFIDTCYVCELTEAIDLSYRDEAGETLELRWVGLSTLELPLFNKNLTKVIEDYLEL